ncbi:toprim domain-containing protein [Chryseobacterium sp. TY3]
MSINCKKANLISIKEILESFSLFPSKENSKTAFFFALDRDEKTPSLSVNYINQTAFDFGTGKKYDNVSIVQAIKKCTVSQALEYLSQFSFTESNSQKQPKTGALKYEILKIDKVTHPALREYLKARKLESQVSLLREIHYKSNDKTYFGIGFKNDSDGYEFANKFQKQCLLKKDITWLQNDNSTVQIFESWSDFLSFNVIFPNTKNTDFIILNSISMTFKCKNILSKYQKVNTFLDNDGGGTNATNEIQSYHSNVDDHRLLYQHYKDLNDFLKHKIERNN